MPSPTKTSANQSVSKLVLLMHGELCIICAKWFYKFNFILSTMKMTDGNNITVMDGSIGRQLVIEGLPRYAHHNEFLSKSGRNFRFT